MNDRLRSAALASLAVAALALLALRSWRIDQPYSIDFQTYWLAGTRVAEGDAAALYDPGGGPDEGIPLHLPANEFKNLPIVSLLFLPFASLDYLDAKRVFWWLGLGSLGIAGWIVPVRRVEFTACLALFAVMDPAHVSLRHGQTTPLVLVALAGYVSAARKGRDALAGVLLGAACLVKFPPLLLLAAEGIGRHRRRASYAAMTILAGTALSVAVFGPALHGAYLRGVAAHVGTVMTGHNNQSLLAVVTRFVTTSPALDWTPRPAPLAARILVSMILAILAAILAAVLRRPRSPSPGATYTAAIALGLLAFPVSWDHYFLLLAPGVYLMAAELGERGLLGRPSWAMPFLLGTLAIAAPTPHGIIEAADRLGRLSAPGLAMECAGALTLFGVGVAILTRRTETPE